MNTDRRRFLGLTGFAAGLAVAPAWIRGALAAPLSGEGPVDTDGGDKDERTHQRLLEARELSQRSGKPLLILLIPDDDFQEGYARGHAWGELLNHGAPAQLAPLALCEIVAARYAAVARWLPGEVPTDTTALLIDPTSLHSRRGVKGPIQRLPEIAGPRLQKAGETWADRQAREAQSVEDRIDHVAEELAKLIKAEGEQLDRYARLSEVALSERSDPINAALARGAVPAAAQIDAGAALVMRAAVEAKGDLRATLIEALAQSVHARLKDHHTPAGVLWAKSTGCGTRVEYPPKEADSPFQGRNMAVGCGMGHVPAKSQRFLHFYVDEERW